MPMDIEYPLVRKPKSCIYTVTAKSDQCPTEPLPYKQADLLNKIWMFDELEAALFALEQLQLNRGIDLPVGWEYQVRRIEKNVLDNPQRILLVSWKRLPDIEDQCPGTATGTYKFHSGLNCC